MLKSTIYKAKQFNLSGLQGISDKTLQMHFKLYEGYVKGVNDLNEKIAKVLADDGCNGIRRGLVVDGETGSGGKR